MLQSSDPTTLLQLRADKLNRRITRWNRWRKFNHERWEKWIQVRLLVGLVFFGALVATAWPGNPPWLAATTFFIILPAFIFLIWTTAKIKSSVKLADGLIDFYQRELSRLNGTFEDPRHSQDKEDPDLQRTGEKSLLSLMDESFTTLGRKLLTKDLMEHKAFEETLKTRDLLKNLQSSPWPLTRWLIEGQGQREPVNTDRIDGLFKSFQMTASDKAHSYASILGFLSFIAAFIILGPETSAVWYIFFAQGMIHLSYLPRSYRLLHRALELSHHWEQLDKQTKTLLKKDLWRRALPQSFIFQKFSVKQSSRLKRLISLSDINNHPILSIVIHLAIPWLPTTCLFLGKFLEEWKIHWPEWRDDFLLMERLSNLAVFSHWLPISLPEFSTEADRTEILATELYHPLIERSSRVANNLDFKEPLKTVLLSGSNMAGKSTFLRTLAINQILAVAGLPVFAQKFQTFHGPVLSCIQISDSLRDGFSYFMSEVLRLRDVLQEASRPERPCLVVIDEIFRGTNNRERHLGSQSVIKKLVGSPSLSIVSTHDLELTKLADENSKVENYHFKEDYQGQTMIFHYKLYKGPSPTTNALKIMAQNGLYEEQP